MKSCEKYQEYISELIDGELDTATEEKLLAHIEQCDDCREMYLAFKAVSASMDLEDVPENLHEGIMNRVDIAVKAKRTHRKVTQMQSFLGMAACLVFIVGTLFAVRTTGKAKNMMKSATSIAAGQSAEVFEAPESMESGADAPEENQSEQDTMQVFDEKYAIAFSTKADSIPEEPSSDCAPESEAFSMKLRILKNEADYFVGIVTDQGNQDIFRVGDEVTVYQTKQTAYTVNALPSYETTGVNSSIEEQCENEIVTVSFNEFDRNTEEETEFWICADEIQKES